MICQLDAEVQIAGRQEVVQNVEDSDDENTNVLQVEPSRGNSLVSQSSKRYD